MWKAASREQTKLDQYRVIEIKRLESVIEKGSK